MRGVFTAGTVAFFAADVPFGDLFCFDVVVDGVASVAGWARRALYVVGRVERLPPIGSRLDEIWQPFLVGDVPLRAFGEIIVADFFEVALLPDAAVDEG